LLGSVILLGCASIYIPEKKGGYNAFIRPPFLWPILESRGKY
jgi:hypothetical protein